MDVLLDTNVVARLLGTAGRRIRPSALDVLSQPRHRLWVSSVSAYELINKVRLGKWPQAEMIALGWMDRLSDIDAQPLALSGSLSAVAFSRSEENYQDRKSVV